MKKYLLLLLPAVLAALVACDPWAGEVPTSSHYPLIGGHSVATCESCHPTDRIAPAPTDCEACHLDVKPIPHYDGECADCHTPRGWDQFLHDFFPLDNAHDLECLDCHEADDYTTLDPACITCHADDEPPNHYGPACEDCHRATTWQDADFDHRPFFPIPHEGNGDCIDCHTTGDNSTFECIECHEHRKGKTDNEHNGVNNYAYNSIACLDCHPRGQAD